MANEQRQLKIIPPSRNPELVAFSAIAEASVQELFHMINAMDRRIVTLESQVAALEALH